MKNLYFILFSLFIVNANAQYFHHVYGTDTYQTLSSGVNTFAQGEGHILAGTDFGNNQTLMISFADINGDVPGGPYFDLNYTVSDLGGNVLNATDPQVFEMDNGAGFGVVGKYSDPSGGAPNGIYYLQLDPSGNIMNVWDYTPNPGTYTWDIEIVSAVAEAAGGNEIYVTGSAQAIGAPEIHVFVLKLDVNSGGIIWSQIFDMANPCASSKDFAYDIIESPYQPLGVPEVVIVGATYDNCGSTTTEGFLMRVDANTGTLSFPWTLLHGEPNSEDFFHTITVAQNTAGGFDGFVIGGMTDMHGSLDFWLKKVDRDGINSAWSATYDYSVNPGGREECWDVIERLNTNGKYEYYAVGHTDKGVFGNHDVLVIKTDDMGVGVVGGEFTYGDANEDFGKSADQYNGMTADGLSVFSYAETGGLGLSNLYLVKAYFNGISGCQEFFSDPQYADGPKSIGEYYMIVYSNFSQSSLNANSGLDGDVAICYNTSIASGSNARVAPAQNGSNALVVSPNPMQTGTALVNVEIETTIPSEVDVAVYDMLGRQYYNRKFILATGKNRLPLDISNAGMAAGMYTIRITEATNSRNMLLMVK